MSAPASGGYDFLADPDARADQSPAFWRPNELASVVILAAAPAGASQSALTLADLPAEMVRRDAEDGAHLMVRSEAGLQQLWVTAGTDAGASLAAIIPLDAMTAARADAVVRLWEAQARGSSGPRRSRSRRLERLIAALQALDARLDGASYRAIAEVIFGPRRVADEAWKTSSLRDAVIRIARTGVALMRGGYRKLLKSKPPE
ncbi:DUF2285 domain-containing protein [Acidisphaera rubrifaciens]|uniref:T6SS Transcription factor RovC-like DNA binding domain-containing protein n=1 Tax=Acidisphaera rubrifaciens HS-AP3 TaxID=1231350 RepID=A0A0D6P2E2_9PROT|nr:DUF2285 domain-containing protein [Acidisphaera rubrifaciens]GAN75827.1 hypothetical protein Asru_0009_20 [Acidisphaera rubrifaciens HS-AP3]